MNRKECLNEADRCVNSDRNKQNGPPEDSFATIADMWNAYVSARLGLALAADCSISATDVAAMMALVKVARLATNPGHADSWVDLAGYAACGAEIATKPATIIDSLASSKPMTMEEAFNLKREWLEQQQRAAVKL